MPALSVFDMLKIGVGPSSSHTLGPWRAVQRWIKDVADVPAIERVRIILYGSLALTGKGHCTDTAICLALLGHDPETVQVDLIASYMEWLHVNQSITIKEQSVAFNPSIDIEYRTSQQLPYHANGMECVAHAGGEAYTSTYYSVGGGFVVKEGEDEDGAAAAVQLPYPCEASDTLLERCTEHRMSIADMVWANEQCWRSPDQIRHALSRIWAVMKRGHVPGVPYWG